jgi:hypothetical protein
MIFDDFFSKRCREQVILRQNIFYHVAMDIGETEVATLE